VFERTTCVRTHQLFVVEHRVQVRPQITAATARADWACVRPQGTCVRTHITARAGCCVQTVVAVCVRECSVRATVLLQAGCDRGTCCVLSVAGRAFERTKCSRTHFGRFYTLCPLSSPC
jgi:hypothetical protein